VSGVMSMFRGVRREEAGRRNTLVFYFSLRKRYLAAACSVRESKMVRSISGE
jgi:hypothetical protein